MPSTSDELHLALSNTITKKSMFSLLVNYLKSGKAPLIYLTMINDEDNTWMIELSSGNVTELFLCNHEEEDTHMMCHASLQTTTNVVIVANGFDMLFLGTFACAMNKSRRWFYNYEGSIYADLTQLAAFYGDIALYFPMFHHSPGVTQRLIIITVKKLFHGIVL